MKIAFVCVHNSCRSQIAEGLAKFLNKDNSIEIYSAGTEKYHEVKPKAVIAMKNLGIDISNQFPKLLTNIPDELDILITMGCNVVCPFVPNRYQEDWGLDDPSGGPLEDFENTRDLIKDRVIDLLNRIERGVINGY